MLWNAKPTPRIKPREGESVWAMTNGARHLTCELRYHGEFGVEAQFLRDGELVIGRRFDTKALAVQWAEQERETLEGTRDNATR